MVSVVAGLIRSHHARFYSAITITNTASECAAGMPAWSVVDIGGAGHSLSVANQLTSVRTKPRQVADCTCVV